MRDLQSLAFILLVISWHWVAWKHINNGRLCWNCTFWAFVISFMSTHKQFIITWSLVFLKKLYCPYLLASHLLAVTEWFTYIICDNHPFYYAQYPVSPVTLIPKLFAKSLQHIWDINMLIHTSLLTDNWLIWSVLLLNQTIKCTTL